jgi:hypothetical protein
MMTFRQAWRSPANPFPLFIVPQPGSEYIFTAARRGAAPLCGSAIVLATTKTGCSAQRGSYAGYTVSAEKKSGGPGYGQMIARLKDDLKTIGDDLFDRRSFWR